MAWGTLKTTRQWKKSGLWLKVLGIDEVDAQAGSLITAFYAQFQPQLPEKDADDGFGWLYDTSILLVILQEFHKS